MYNSENTITRCINSIENQNVDFNFDIIIVDDGSTDKSVATVQRVQKNFNNIKLIKQKNQKQASARNNGINHADGSYIMFVDIDDFILPKMLNSMVSLMEDGNELVMCGIIKRFYDHREIETHSVMESSKSKKKLLINYLTRNEEFDVGVWNKIFSKDILEKNDIYFENKNFFEDSFFVFRYLIACQYKFIKFIHKPFYVLNKHNGTTTRHFSPEIDRLAEDYVDKVLKLLSKNSIKLLYKYEISFRKRILIYIIHHHIKYDMNWSGKKQREYCKGLEINFPDLRGITVLPWKYTVAYIVMRRIPKFYSLLYSSHNT